MIQSWIRSSLLHVCFSLSRRIKTIWWFTLLCPTGQVTDGNNRHTKSSECIILHYVSQKRTKPFQVHCNSMIIQVHSFASILVRCVGVYVKVYKQENAFITSCLRLYVHVGVDKKNRIKCSSHNILTTANYDIFHANLTFHKANAYCCTQGFCKDFKTFIIPHTMQFNFFH